jgi:hypothetical protein
MSAVFDVTVTSAIPTVYKRREEMKAITAMARIRKMLVLLLFAVFTSHVRPMPSIGEYFIAYFTELYSAGPFMEKGDHSLCTRTFVNRIYGEWLEWVVNLSQMFKIK